MTITPEQLKDKKIEVITLTPERNEQFRKLSLKIAKELEENTESPLEAYMILQSLILSLEEVYGIESGGFLPNPGDKSSAS
jgi:hypothetical protein